MHTSRGAALGPVVAAFAAGTVIGGSVAARAGVATGLPAGLAVSAIAVAASIAAAAAAPRCRRGPLRLAWIAAAAAGLGTVVGLDRSAAPPPHGQIAAVTGVLAAAPRALDPPPAALTPFFGIAPRTELRVRTRGAHGMFWQRRPITRVIVHGRVEGRTGDRVQVEGVWRSPRPRSNPGPPRRRGGAFVDVPDPRLVRIDPESSPGPAARLSRLRTAVRARALRAIDAAHDESAPERTAFLGALLVGRRTTAFTDTAEPFRRLGIAHLLAISGMHLAIVLGLALAITGSRADRRLRRSVVALVTVGLYLTLVEARPPVVRAAIMACLVAAGSAGRRRWSAEGLLALAALVLLVQDPGEALRPGFQLSFGVVFALVRLAPHVRTRWLGPRAALAARPRAMVKERVRDAVAIAVTAWAVATPLTMYHFGVVTPLGAIASLVVAPFLAPLLAAGYLAVSLSCVWPEAGATSMRIVAGGSGILLEHIERASALPGCRIRVAAPGALWTLAALAWLWVALADVRVPRRRTALCASGAALLTAQIWAHAPWTQPALRLDAIDVGAGSCLLLRSGGRAMLFDAGARTAPGIAFAIAPALRRLGVRELDAIAISHGHLDHYAAVPELLTAFGPCPVLITPQMLAASACDPSGSDAHLLGWLQDHGVTIEIVAAGVCRDLGSARLDWVHPTSHDLDLDRNDESMVIVAEASGTRAVLAGDLGAEGIARVRARVPELRADIVEVPHHGSDEVAAEDWIAELAPRVALQSCAARRIEFGVTFEVPRACVHLVTARDGACGAMTVRGGGVRWWSMRRRGPGVLNRRRAAPSRAGSRSPASPGSASARRAGR